MGFITKDRNGKKLKVNDVVIIEWGFQDLEITTMCYTTPMNYLTARSKRQTLYDDCEYMITKVTKKNFKEILEDLNNQRFGQKSVYRKKD